MNSMASGTGGAVNFGNMAIAGKNGKVVVGTSGTEKVVGIKNWSLELSLETLDTTALGDDWKNYIRTL